MCRDFQDVLPLVSMRKIEAILGFQRDYLLELAETAGRHYSSFDRRKKGTTKWRHIDNPNKNLKEVQRRIQKRIFSKIPLPPTMLGGVSGGSIIANARKHVSAKKIVTLDIRSCFPSTNHKKIYSVYKKYLQCSSEIASLLTKLTTFQTRLPQGAPTSPMLANFALLPLHDEVAAIALAAGLNCTFYVDDIALSGENPELVIEQVVRTIQGHGYSAPNAKKKIMRNDELQTITGIVVNKKPNIAQSYIEKLRKEMVKALINRDVSDCQMKSFAGRVNYIKMINKRKGEKVEELFDRLRESVTAYPGKEDDLFEYRNCKSTKCHAVQRRSHIVIPVPAINIHCPEGLPQQPA